jgi:hypothetical protein
MKIQALFQGGDYTVELVSCEQYNIKYFVERGNTLNTQKPLFAFSLNQN